MDVSYVSIIHTIRDKDWQFIALAVTSSSCFSSKLWCLCCYMWLCMLLSYPQFSFNSFFKRSVLFFACWRADMLLYTNISQLCSCQYQKREKRQQQQKKKERKKKYILGSSLLPLPVGNNVLFLFHTSDAHKGHHNISKKFYTQKETVL